MTEADYIREIRKPRMDLLIRQVSGETGISTERLKSPRRHRDVARARFLFMYRAHMAGFTTTQIGTFLSRDHSTVVHGIQRMKEALK